MNNFLEVWTKTESGYIYEAKDKSGERVLLTIWKTEGNTWRAKNCDFDITAEIKPLDDYRTEVVTIVYKQRDRAGRYRNRKSGSRLQSSALSWLVWYLEKHGFIREPKVMER